jgi:hypothetical protein
MHVAQDANMKLNNCAHRRGNVDAPLQPGSAYMVNPKPLNEYLKAYIDQKEVSAYIIILLCQL